MTDIRSIWNRFLVFTASLFVCVGGGVYFLRMMADELSSVEANAENLVLLAAFWAIPLVTFLKFLFRAGFRQTLTFPAAILIFIGYAQIIGFSFLSYNIFYDKPADNILNRFVSFSEASSQLGTKLPLKIDDTLTLTAIDFEKGTLTYHYEIAKNVRPDTVKLQERATKSSCASLQYHLSHGLVAQVVHEYNYLQDARDPRDVVAAAQTMGDEPPPPNEGTPSDSAMPSETTKETMKHSTANEAAIAGVSNDPFIPPFIFSLSDIECTLARKDKAEVENIKGGENVP